MLSNVCIFVVWDLSYEGMLIQIMTVLSVICLAVLEEGDQTRNSVGNTTSVSVIFRTQSIC